MVPTGRVSQPIVASWLEIEKDVATKTLKLTALPPIDKDGEGSGDARSTMLVLSYSTSHHVLNVQLIRMNLAIFLLCLL